MSAIATAAPHPAAESASDRAARRNARVLTCAQALGGANPAIIVSLGGIVGQGLAPTPALATLPVSVFNLGLAAGTLPAGFVMRRFGRRAGYTLGCGIGLVMAGGLAAAVIGPQTVIWTRDLLPDAPFAGAFLGQAALALLALPIIAFLRPVPVPAEAGVAGRPMREILAQSRFLVAVAAGLVTYGLMSFVMTAAPVAMVGCGHPVGQAALGIQWHVLAMYGPSFFTGRLIARFGKARITALGLLLIAASAVIGLSGLTVAHFWATLVLLGLGWNLGFIGATAMVTECYRPEERNRVQSMNDFLVFGSVAVASFSSGRLLDADGWTAVNAVVFLPVALILALIAWQARRPAPAL